MPSWELRIPDTVDFEDFKTVIRAVSPSEGILKLTIMGATRIKNRNQWVLLMSGDQGLLEKALKPYGDKILVSRR